MAHHTHDHSHSHDHGHAHAHDHHHHEGDSYFIDQLCMVGLSAAFGAICLCLWFWQTSMLRLMLGEQFHLYVMLSGFVLVGLALVRGAILWRQSRDPRFVHSHSHDHHDHVHDHSQVAHDKAMHLAVVPGSTHQHNAGCSHEHAPGETCAHEQHAHGGHAHHHHDHEEADHDHGWAPWRYVVILVPIILFLLGLPSKLPPIQAATRIDGLSADVEQYPRAHGFVEQPGSSGSVNLLAELTPETHMKLLLLRSIAFGGDAMTQLVHAGAALSPVEAGKGEYVDYKLLESLAGQPERRRSWKGKVVEVRGQFAPYPGTDQIFMLARYKISCCANDRIQLNVPMVSRESIRGIATSDWIKVTGRIDFREGRNGSYYTVVLISKASNVVKCEPDTNPYIQ